MNAFCLFKYRNNQRTNRCIQSNVMYFEILGDRTKFSTILWLTERGEKQVPFFIIPALSFVLDQMAISLTGEYLVFISSLILLGGKP